MTNNGVQYASVNNCLVYCNLEYNREQQAYLQVGNNCFLILSGGTLTQELVKIANNEARAIVKRELNHDQR